MKKILSLFGVASLVILAIQVPSTALPAGTPHYPDLVTRVPSGVRLVAGKGGATTRRMFFANTIGNLGAGPLELRPENSSSSGTTNAYQEIYTHAAAKGGTGAMVLVSTSLVGTFVFHPAHNHWHMADFARYELRAINPDGSTGAVVASTDKVSFCMIDTDVVDSSLPDYNMGLSHACGQSNRQGLRVGRGDTYSASLPDQFIDITTLPDGTYRLVSVSDPSNRLIETNDGNNAATVDVVVTRTSVTIVPGSGQTGIPAP